ncbi:MAG: hypothetical protein HY825_12555 [Acidobacteria bacterium]|nr:hypothetical protein [Acidobacteriota bacterium]
MTDSDLHGDRTLDVAAGVARILEDLGVPSALIGAAALAVHGYPRATEDVDLAVATDPFSTLAAARRRIEEDLGVAASLVTPDADDPLGGVLTVTGEGFDPVQVVNFLNPLGTGSNPGRDAVEGAASGLIAGSSLRVVTVPYLVALKLYAGGYKSTLDVLELLARNPAASRDEIGTICVRFGLAAEWGAIVTELAR